MCVGLDSNSLTTLFALRALGLNAGWIQQDGSKTLMLHVPQLHLYLAIVGGALKNPCNQLLWVMTNSVVA